MTGRAEGAAGGAAVGAAVGAGTPAPTFRPPTTATDPGRADMLRGVCGALVALALWQALAWGTGGFLIAGPVEVVGWLRENTGLVTRATGTTLSAAAAGFVLGNLAAVSMAVLVLLLPRTERMVSGLALLVFCLPFVATGPILRVLMGPGLGPQIAVAALAVYYTTYLALLVGLRAAPAAWFDLVRSYGRGRGAELLRVRARAAVPYFIAGLQIAAPAAFLGAMIGEFTGAERGLGVLTISAMRGLDVPATWGIASVASVMAILAYLALGALGRRLSAPPALILAPPQRGRDGRSWLQGLALLAAALLIWQAAMDGFGLNPFFAKRPWDVWVFLVAAPEAAANRVTLALAFAQTMILTLPGYLAGLALGAGLAALIVLRPLLAAFVLPPAIALRSIPIVTTAPLIVLALGRGATGTISIVAVMIFFPTLVACLNGLRQAPGQVMDVFASYAASPWQRLRYAQVPAMLPAFFAAARMAVPAAVLAATVSEWLATGIGMGSLMALSYSTSAYGMLWSAVVLLSLTAVLAYVAVERLERAVLRVYGPEQLAR
jgi:ABC-type nitrate/sulfonate/bicarbonate transport system permease component